MHPEEQTWLPKIPEEHPLDTGEVQLWLINLDHHGEPLLNTDEWRRAEQIVAPLARHRFIQARSQLRRLLGCATGISPGLLEFVYGPSGKPALPGNGCEFNLSHAGNRALVALSRSLPVGVDLEQLSNSAGRLQAALLRRVASAQAAGMLEKEEDASARNALFLDYWTQHEALAKLGGVSLFNRQQVEKIRQNATLIQLRPGQDCMGALATLKDSFTLHTYHMHPDP